MKPIKKISLRSLNDEILRENEMSHIMGGNECGCGCDGSASHASNLSFNYADNKFPAHSCNYTSYDGTDMGVVVRPNA